MGFPPSDAKPTKTSGTKNQAEFPRQVHFNDQSSGGFKAKSNTAQKTTPVKPAASSETAPTNTQPSSFPAVGQAPGGSSFPGGEWHTAVDPTRSVNLPGQIPGFQQQGFYPGQAAVFPSNQPYTSPQPHVTYIGNPQSSSLPPGSTMAADYQNAAPPPHGLNFQPPVPDTTFGPMMHTYVPRFDGAPMHGPPAGYPPGAAQFHPQPGYAVPQNQPGYVYAQQPPVMQQPVAGQQQPVMINGQPYIPAAGQGCPAVQVPGMAGGPPVGGGYIAGNAGHVPEVAGLGRTPNEEMLRQVQFAHANRLFESQDFKPADDDPSRFYFVREVDGNWTQRNRFTIDHMGDCRWYVTDEGWFYAVRLPN